MLSFSTKFIFAAMLLAAIASGVEAQRIHPACAKVRDKVKCNCLLANGGHIVQRPGGKRTVAMDSMHNIDRFIRCMRRNGRPNG
jgi:hypothetical protein